MRLAFVDLRFAWPPSGGADTDLYYTVSGLQNLGHDCHVFVAGYEKSWQRRKVNPADVPFPVTWLEFTARTFTRREVPARLRAAVDRWRPDIVFLTHGFFLKPYLAEAFADCPTAARYYAYELTCTGDFRMFKDGALCERSFLENPDACRRCAVERMKGELTSWRLQPWTREYLAARAFMPGYHERVVRSLASLDGLIVYNRIQKGYASRFNPNVYVVPGGVDIARFPFHPPPPRREDGRVIVLMVGRAEDPAKGVDTLRRAAARLAEERRDFEVWATHTDFKLNTDTFKAIGWHDHAEITSLYRQADVCVVPSVWEEPFGLVAVEAMATGRPVCASRVGGLQDIVVDGETGFLFDREDHATLSERLAALLDDPALRERMGRASRQRVEEEYAWEQVVRRHYPPMLERLLS